MTAKAIPRHARTSGRQRWVPPPPREGRLHRGRAPGMARPGPPVGPMPADPLAGPVAITQRAVLGDQIRRPTAWCEMAACISRYEDPAALGEADIRGRALAAGWQHDHVGRLLCPYCQWRRPRLQAAYPVAGQDNPPALQQTGHAQAGRISAVRAALSAAHRRLPGGQDLRPRWPHLLALLLCGRNGWTTPAPALPWARLASCTAPGRQVPAILRGTGQPPLHPPMAAGMTTAASWASGPSRTPKPRSAGPGGAPHVPNSGGHFAAINLGPAPKRPAPAQHCAHESPSAISAAQGSQSRGLLRWPGAA
jgi:hypothetical protein